MPVPVIQCPYQPNHLLNEFTIGSHVMWCREEIALDKKHPFRHRLKEVEVCPHSSIHHLPRELMEDHIKTIHNDQSLTFCNLTLSDSSETQVTPILGEVDYDWKKFQHFEPKDELDGLILKHCTPIPACLPKEEKLWHAKVSRKLQELARQRDADPENFVLPHPAEPQFESVLLQHPTPPSNLDFTYPLRQRTTLGDFFSAATYTTKKPSRRRKK